jgi:hypothetical protein
VAVDFVADELGLLAFRVVLCFVALPLFAPKVFERANSNNTNICKTANSVNFKFELF